jgi:hypothetical protein
MVRHPTSGALLPRLIRFHDPAIQETVNRQLDSLAGSLLCDTDPEDSPEIEDSPGSPGSFESIAKVTYAASDVLSVSVHSSYYCGGPYPTNDDNRSVTFDLKTGLIVPFEELFSDYERDAESIIRTLYPKHVARAEYLAATGHDEPGESCDDDAFSFSIPNLLESGFSYALSSEGLIVQPDFPHVSEACAEEIIVQFDQVRRFAAPNGVLARVSDAKRSAPIPSAAPDGNRAPRVFAAR